MSEDRPQSGREAILAALAQPETDEDRARRQLRQRYAATIRRLWVEPDDCPICGSNTWGTGDLIQSQLRPPLSPLAQLLSGPPPQVYVYVPVTCNICGYSMFFHSGVLDVREQEEVKAVPPIRHQRGGQQP